MYIVIVGVVFRELCYIVFRISWVNGKLEIYEFGEFLLFINGFFWGLSRLVKSEYVRENFCGLVKWGLFGKVILYIN